MIFSLFKVALLTFSSVISSIGKGDTHSYNNECVSLTYENKKEAYIGGTEYQNMGIEVSHFHSIIDYYASLNHQNNNWSSFVSIFGNRDDNFIVYDSNNYNGDFLFVGKNNSLGYFVVCGWEDFDGSYSNANQYQKIIYSSLYPHHQSRFFSYVYNNMVALSQIEYEQLFEDLFDGTIGYTNYMEIDKKLFSSIFNSGTTALYLDGSTFQYNYFLGIPQPREVYDGSYYRFYDSYKSNSSQPNYEQYFYTPMFQINGCSLGFNYFKLEYISGQGYNFRVNEYYNDNVGDFTLNWHVGTNTDSFFYSLSVGFCAENDVDNYGNDYEYEICHRHIDDYSGSDNVQNLVYDSLDFSFVESSHDYGFVYQYLMFSTDYNFITPLYVVGFSSGNQVIQQIPVVVGDGDTRFYLGQSFSLINMAMSGLVGFFSIQVLPSITIGSLILIPVALVLLIFVIKLFKR